MSNMIQTQTIPSFMKREEDETMVKLKQGIVTILGDNNSTYITPSSASSLRRTLSADMSSKKWTSLPQHEEEKDNQDSFKMKKIPSSEELTQHHPTNSYSSSSSSSDEGEEEEEKEEEEEAERERLAIWSSILKNKKEEQEKTKGGFDTWGSIMSMKSSSSSSNNNNHNLEMTKSLPVSVTVTPYVHPLVKRSKSSLSDKSLQICTESLGSETGSDTSLFSSSSSYPSPQSGESEKVVRESEPEAEDNKEENISNNNHLAAITKSKLLSHPRCFPPPLPSLSFHGCNKSKGDSSSSTTTTTTSSSSSLHMKQHRDNGRLVLQAVSLPSNNNFNAQRQDGRLVLTFTNDQQVPEVEEDEEVEESYDDEVMEEEEEFEEQEEEEEEVFEEDVDYEEEEENLEEEDEKKANEVEVVMEKKTPLMSSGITTTINSGGGNLHRLTLMMNNNNKTIGLVNRNINPNWSEKFNNKGVNLEDVNVSVVEMTKSLPQRVARLIPSTPGSTTSPPPSSFNLNAYEYYWKTPKPSSQLPNNNKNKEAIVCGGENQFSSNNNEQLLVLRGKNGDYLVHNFKGCKDSRRSLLFWEPYCVATS
ncbi:hypothetical protein PIB30_011178 [Stylosanthes scabra]|uniref:FAF domain-containing protein n=1 Tax=Stylosanthes scabra TaxID=79078 RepID=A0ABU6R5R1_9FABA|nr:hypothetical protein [Stylosanthes scabra]